MAPSPESAALLACVGCGGMVPDIAGPTHPYMRASPGCWLWYGELSARHDYGNVARPPVHWHHMDCYAVQHPGGARTERRQRQSVAVHLIALCLFNEHGIPPQQAPRHRRQMSATVLPRMGLADWPYLEPPPSLGGVTVADVCQAANDADYEAAVTDWAAAAWQAWAPHHATIGHWAVAALGSER